eukprot:CAMPEP_0114595304 /NCGR_PEP_ID=MMETSP0125-20121206/17072_1 /TAXON_ID=485358 ORGANISM="Aristerostoma sp., Strain ATCC 50986" /NCGR_SAMPLE_ID=MMETSP0125 /ASSEMBLY_ACC=CAM_ASM_000245 /LENGTH=265 /DNA_ID=CAMNT_0001796697 /DNA_START=336 /DNA_END=1133 /DNA_ORIENTATION=+
MSIGYCGRECSKNQECPIVDGFSEAKCEKGRCHEKNWCPPANASKIYDIIGIDKIQLFLMPIVDFPGMSKFTYRGGSTKEFVWYPDPFATGYTVKDLLSLAGSTIDKHADQGGVFRIQFLIDCNVDSGDCSQEISVKELNVNAVKTPFDNLKAKFYRESYLDIDDNTKEYSMFMGMKFLVSVTGVGRTFSFNKLMILIALVVTTTTFTNILIDFMIRKFSSQHKFFEKHKFEKSEDFSDLIDRLGEVKNQRELNYEDMDDEDDEH